MGDRSTSPTTGATIRQYRRGLGTRTAKGTSASRRKKAPFRRTFDSASAATDRFYSENLGFLQPILDHGEPREAVREWLRSNAHGRTGRMKVKDLSKTPWAAKMLAGPDPVKAALRNVFGHAVGRRWDRADWDAIRALGETLAEFGGDGATSGPGGWTWFPIAIEDDDAKILDRLSVEGDPDAYRAFASSLSDREVQEVVTTYEREVERLARCMSPERRRHIEARLAEVRRWKTEGIPESVCGQSVYAGHTCDLEPLHGELKRLRDACESDAAYMAWRNEAVRRSPRPGSVAEDEEGDVPVELVPVEAFDGEEPATTEMCTPSEAARIMGRIGAAKRRENAAKRRKTREANAAARRAERERVSKARKAQREASRRKPRPKSAPKDRGTAAMQSKPVEPASVALTYEERLAIGGTARDKALFETHGSGRIGQLVVNYIDAQISTAENRELEALGLAKGDALTEDGWVLYQSIKGGGNPKAAPATRTSGGWTFYTGWAPKHFREAGFATMVRDPLSAEQSPDRKAKRKRWGNTPHLAIKKLDKAELGEAMLRDLPSVEPATLHKLALTTFGLAGDVVHETKVEEALWDLVEAGEVEHTLSSMLGNAEERAQAKFGFVLFRVRGSRKNPPEALVRAVAERRRLKKDAAVSSASGSVPTPTPKNTALTGLKWEYAKSRGAWRLLNAHGYQVAAMSHSARGIWIAFTHPPGREAPRVHIDDEAELPAAKAKVEQAVLGAVEGEWWTDLRPDPRHTGPNVTAINQVLSPSGWKVMALKINEDSGFVRLVVEQRDHAARKGRMVTLARSTHDAKVVMARDTTALKPGAYRSHWTVVDALGQSRHEGLAPALQALVTDLVDNAKGRLSTASVEKALRPITGVRAHSYTDGESAALSASSAKAAGEGRVGAPRTMSVLEVFTAAVMREVKPKHVARAIKRLVEQEGLLPPGYTLSARTPREGIVYLSARTRGKRDSAAVIAGMQRLFPEFRDGLGQSELHLVPQSWSSVDQLKTVDARYAETLRVLAQREAGVQTGEVTLLDQPTPRVNDTPVKTGAPKRYKGAWAAEVVGEARVGDPLRIVARGGKQWDAVVTEVIRTYATRSRGLSAGGRRTLVRTAKLPPAVLRGRPAPGGEGLAPPKRTRGPERAGAGLRFFGRDAASKDRLMRWEDGIAVLEGQSPPPWAVYVFAYPKERKFAYVRGNGGYRVEVYGQGGLGNLSEALRRLRRDRDAGKLAKDEVAMLETLAGFHARAPVSSQPGAQGLLVTPEQEGFALTHSRGTAGVHGSSAGTGGTQTVLPGVGRKVSAAKLSEMKERGLRAPARSTDMSRMTTAKLHALRCEQEAELGVDGWSRLRQDAHFDEHGAVLDELLARRAFVPVHPDAPDASPNDRPLGSMTPDDVDNAFRGKDPGFAAPRWLVTNIAYVIAPKLLEGGLTLVRGPLGKWSARAESLYVLRKGMLVGYRGRRARVSVRRYGGYYTVEVEGVPRAVEALVASAVRDVMGDPKLGMQDQGGGQSWRRA